MMAHNLCYTTLLDKATIDKLHLEKDRDYIQTPNNGKDASLNRRVVLTRICLTCRLFRHGYKT